VSEARRYMIRFIRDGVHGPGGWGSDFAVVTAYTAEDALTQFRVERRGVDLHIESIKPLPPTPESPATKEEP
jgi:hypothetical protein